MTRQRLGEKKVSKIRKETGLQVIAVLVRGNSNHRKDLCLEDGTIVHLYRDGTMEASGLRYYMMTPNANVTGLAPAQEIDK